MNSPNSSCETASRETESMKANRRRWFKVGLAGISAVMIAGETAYAQISGRASNSKSRPDRRRSVPVSTRATPEDQDAASPPVQQRSKPNPGKAEDTTRWREGHRIENVTATLQISDTERFTASIDSERNLVVLENLSLERIAEAMKIDSSDNRWTVYGRVTEFRGQNYLWIERATRAAKISAQ